MPNNATVAHNWFHQTGKAQNGSNFYYNNLAIYSYGSHYTAGVLYPKSLMPNLNVGEGNEGLVLINSNTYSSSTSKHLGHIRGAIDHHSWVVLHVPEPNLWGSHWVSDNPDYETEELQKIHPYSVLKNIKHWLREIDDLLDKQDRARTVAYSRDIEREAKDLQTFVSVLEPMHPEVFSFNEGDWKGVMKKVKLYTSESWLESIREKDEALIAYQKKRERIAAEREAKALAENLDTFRHTGDIMGNLGRARLTYLFVSGHPDYEQRVVKTSRGVTVGFREARKFILYLNKFASNRAGEIVDSITDVNGSAWRISQVTENHVKLGCHIIPLKEIVVAAQEMQLIVSPELEAMALRTEKQEA